MCSPELATQPVADVGGPGVGGQTPKKARASGNEMKSGLLIGGLNHLPYNY